MLDVDDEAMHFRHRRIAAADGEQRQHAEEPGERQQRAVPGIHSRTHASAMLTGTMTASTSGSGHCMTPIAAKVANAISGRVTALLWNSGRAILATVAIISPAAAEATPVSARRSAGRSP